ncbi:hypothetical protein ACFQUU_29265 [Herbaspirillum sp. GCM10030257]|uniref:hypothetical protein n=1 Tax=Herbaspirillum sp. GCM10030257 TaxID=3273393 RepID=UPI00362044AD
MTTQLKSPKGNINPLNRYGIADAARTRITVQIFRNTIKPVQKQLESAAVAKNKAQKQI